MKKLLSTLIFLLVIALIQLAAQNRVYTPNLISPENEALSVVPDIILNWQAVSGIHGEVAYDAQLDTDPAFSNPVIFNTNLSGAQMEDLIFGQQYYWRVRAIDGPDVSGWSEVWSFTVLNTMKLLKPANFKIDQTPDVELGWTGITGADFYDIQIDTSYYWKNRSGITTVDINGVALISDTEAWLVGNSGLLLHYAGDSFEIVLDTLTEKNLNAVSITAGGGFGAAVGDDGTVVYWEGTEWDIEPASGITEDLNCVAFLANDNGWAGGTGGALYHFDGTVWNDAGTSFSDDIYGMFFVDENNGWIVGKGGFIAYWNGTEWTEQTSSVTKDFTSVFFLTPNYGWACSKGGKLIHYDGFEWMEASSGSTKDLTSIAFLNPTLGYAIGIDGTLLEYDGINWFSSTIGFEADYNTIGFFDGTLGFAAGMGGTIMKYDLGGFVTPGNIISVPGNEVLKKMQYLLFGEVYAWRVRARHATDTSGWSPAWSFTTQAAPELQKPEENAADLGMFEKFEWKKITGVVDYTLEMDTDPAFSAPLIYISETNTDSIEFYHFGETMYWRVRANHLKDQSEWSAVRMFTNIDVVYLDLPQNGAVNQIDKPTLSWDAISGVNFYEVLYDTLPDMTNPCCQEIIEAPKSNYKIGWPLRAGKTYYWKVRAIKGVDTTQYSEKWSFTVAGPQGIQEISEQNLNMYPNPSNGYIYLDYSAKQSTDLQVYVLDLVGQVLMEQKISFSEGSNIRKLDLNNLSNGIYILRFQNGEQHFSRKINLFK